MKVDNDYKARQIFQERIKKGLLGPGSDIFVTESEIEEEIISDYPLQRYYTGIIYPEKELISSFSEQSDAECEAETSNDEDSENINNIEVENAETNTKLKGETEDDELKVSQNNFFPTNIGLTFCIPDNKNEIDVEFNFGLYSQIEKEVKIKISENDFNIFQENKSFPFKKIIRYENGYMILERKLKGKAKSPRTEEFDLYDNFKKSDDFKDSPIKYVIHYFDKLIGRTWVRENINIREKIKIEDILIPKIIYEKDLVKKKENKLKIGYTVKTYKIDKNPNNIYVKIQLVNISNPHKANKFSNANEILNQKSIFQAEIMVISKDFQPYKSYSELNPLDKEVEILNYLYKDVNNFAIGHNCSVTWDFDNNKPQFIKTTFLPEYNVKDTKNSFSEEDFKDIPNDYKTLNDSLDIYNLSHFSTVTKQQTIEKLKKFVDLYGNWIDKQKKLINGKPNEVEKEILKNLDNNYNRLKRNISFLNDDKIFRAFQLANTAMLIQIIISTDKDFAGKEKDISELNENTNYKELNFFKTYNKIKPKYRPFQLVFLLLKLNIENQDIDEETGKEIVDLIWFPTGGGKTEAYLAVAAFTILYRRLSNEVGYEGTSVIMRYTLRLLTAQQFERASRLISALEFIRSNFPEELKEDPINIGMWVGMSSTPNTVKEAIEKVEKINEECNKLNNKKAGYPEQYNVFQISSCPWCGTKLISKNKNNYWVQGFSIEGRGKNSKFNIKCLNERCHFHNKLPVQVVDEMLYKKPPTLLFGTVDKFAMLAWRANGHKFFNSLDDVKLPPDLIIQDELHLLTGPLGSITGIYESVIDILCTKKDKNGEVIKKPKIISSTATTRNTDEQIKALYGNNKKVNIFPPSGLSYKDSFFARVATEDSKRRYLGFIPTGKTAIDTQLQVLANLFVARIEVYKELIQRGNKDYATFDKYWTFVSYYNSLKDVGKIHNKVGDEISNFTSTLQIRLFGEQPHLSFNYLYLYNRDVELTSRIESSKIKQTLKDLEEKTFNETTIKKSENGNTYVNDIIDFVLATNMISVGIDIDRFNIILINGQPRNIAEYIQASSRVGRKYKGLVIDLLDANRARDKSHFEHFIPFHQAFYKSVEPISITPFTENTINKMLASLIITYVRHKKPRMAPDNAAGNFKPEMLSELKEEIKNRFGNGKVYQIFEKELNILVEDWLNKIKNHNIEYYERIETDYKSDVGLIRRPAEKNFETENKWTVMQSMREIDTNSFIKIGLPNLNKK
jgi:hypothetical protein